MKIFINITDFISNSTGIHYYGKINELVSDENIYKLAQGDGYFNSNAIKDLERIIDAKEAIFLNKRDGKGSTWESGDSTYRFNSIKELKKAAMLEFHSDDIVFLRWGVLNSVDEDIIVRAKEILKLTGQTIKIQGFEGFSPNFKHMTEGSEHEVIETPKKYEDVKLQEGVWVIGDYEPLLVLRREYVTVKYP